MKKPKEPKIKNCFKVQIDKLIQVEDHPKYEFYVIKNDIGYITPKNRWSINFGNAQLFTMKKFAKQKINEKGLKNCTIIKVASKGYTIWWKE